ncbi:hypothetical protein [Cryobacterium sp. PH29-G1]|uniref:hypothetical protein n=1 Tax=Cryobacterium sp. PH29-G1 TaxID=3046211 RepID=UPI0024BAB7EB|nr:hypothetical protein [Cryobacterium sp. PH29-G1]MDJ0350117.1 hypothetical protein [Cryobacterium sp. PH29-G1]
MRYRALFKAVAAAAFLSLTLAGCSADKANAKLDPAESPLSKYMSAMYEGFDEETGIALQKDQEELIATCMADEGFDYVPVDTSQYNGMMSDDGEEYGTKKWVAENGYGMSQSPEQIAEQQEQGEAFVDPNQDYVMSLSEGEQAAYYEVLYGVTPTEDELGEGGSYEYDWETSGCQGVASHEANGDQPSPEDHAELYDAISAMYESAQTSPALVKLDAEWSACMADAGYANFSKKADAQEAISTAMNTLYESATESAPDEKALADLRDEELAQAMVDYTCTEDLKYTEASTKVQFDLEEQFIIDHKTELDALIADYEQGK